MDTFGTILERDKGLGGGFDFLRLFLAFSVATFHILQLTTLSLVPGGDTDYIVHSRPIWFAEYAVVPMFFALSGFLITASGLRLSLKNFLINRSLRIIPALAVDVCLCALIIGPLLTVLPLSAYFRDSGFYSYFMNILGYVHFNLPGVFETHPVQFVNGSLWTVPYEILCYILISLFIVFGWLNVRWSVLVVACGMIAVGAILEITNLFPTYNGVWFKTQIANHSYDNILQHCPEIYFRAMSHILIGRECQIVTAFLFGVAFYQLKHFIPYSRKFFIICIAVCMLTAFIFDYTLTWEYVLARIVLLPVIAYMTVFIGLTKISIPQILKRGDYSYGIYLYHMPILQCVISISPIFLAKYFGSILTLICGFPLVLLFAAFSWHTMEKPILMIRKRFSFVARIRT